MVLSPILNSPVELTVHMNLPWGALEARAARLHAPTQLNSQAREVNSSREQHATSVDSFQVQCVVT